MQKGSGVVEEPTDFTAPNPRIQESSVRLINSSFNVFLSFFHFIVITNVTHTVNCQEFWNVIDVSEELSASFIRVTRIGELGTTLALTSNRP
jgi:hypothetical protein